MLFWYQILKFIFFDMRNERDSVVVGIVEKSKSLDFSTMLVFWSLVSLVRNSVVLAVYLLFSVACFFTVHEHLPQIAIGKPTVSNVSGFSPA